MKACRLSLDIHTESDHFSLYLLAKPPLFLWVTIIVSKSASLLPHCPTIVCSYHRSPSDTFKTISQIVLLLCLNPYTVPHFTKRRVKAWQWPIRSCVIWSLFPQEFPLQPPWAPCQVLNIPGTLQKTEPFHLLSLSFLLPCPPPILALLILSPPLENFILVPTSQCCLSCNPPLSLPPRALYS